MTKSDLIDQVASRNSSFTHRDAEILVETIFDSMIQALTRGDHIEIRGFGTFSVKQRGAREGRNPKTGEPVRIPAKRVTHFKVGKQLQKMINPETD
jgi:integration host factor subunit beta